MHYSSWGRRVLTVAVAAVISVMGGGLVAAGASTAHASGPVSGGQITVEGSPVTLDPGTSATQPSSAPWFTLVYGQLFQHNPNGSISPGLATTFTTSTNGLIDTMTLRHGVSFQDGTPFNAKAVQFNLERDLNGDSSGTCPCQPFINSIKDVTTSGSYTVVIHLLHRDDLLYDALSESTAAYMISPTAYAKEGDLNYGLSPVGAGPYRVTQFTPSTSITFEKFDHYYEKGHPYIQEIDVKNVTGDSTLLAALGSGALDIVTFNDGNASTSPAEAISAYGSTTHEVVTKANLWQEMQFNAEKPPFNNIEAREAVAEATDAAPIVGTLAGYDHTTCMIQGPSQLLPVGTACPAGYKTYNPTAATALVQQLDSQYGANFMSFSITDIMNTQVQLDQMEALQKEYDAVGMNVTLNFITHGQMVAAQADGDFNLFAPNPGGSDDNPFISVEDLIVAGAPQNAFGYKSAALNALAVRVETAESPAQEDALWKQLLDEDELDYANIPLMYGSADEFINNDLHGVVFAGRDIYFQDAYWTGS